MVFFIPASKLILFQTVIEDSREENITVETNSQNDRIELMETPEEVKRQVETFKKLEKLKYFEKKQHEVDMKDNINHLLHSSANYLFDTSCYTLFDNKHAENRLMKENANVLQANLTINLCCPRFMEVIVILDVFWFLCTSFCAFVHNKKVDNCADVSLVGSQKKAVAFIRIKTRAQSDYFELTIRFSNVELLVTSGYLGPINSNIITAFLGSSIQNLPKSITHIYNTVPSKNIFTTTAPKPAIKSARLLNQYVKLHTANLWIFITSKFCEKGYILMHPLSFESTNHIQEAISLLLKFFTYRILNKKEVSIAALKIASMKEKKFISSSKLVENILWALMVEMAWSLRTLIKTG